MTRPQHLIRSFFLLQALAQPFFVLAAKVAAHGADDVAPFRVLVALVLELPIAALLVRELVRAAKPFRSEPVSMVDLGLTAARGFAGALVMAISAVLTIDETVVELICGGGYGDGVEVGRLVIVTFASLGAAAALVGVGWLVGFAELPGAQRAPQPAT
jgi:hypothetical protein